MEAVLILTVTAIECASHCTCMARAHIRCNSLSVHDHVDGLAFYFGAQFDVPNSQSQQMKIAIVIWFMIALARSLGACIGRAGGGVEETLTVQHQSLTTEYLFDNFVWTPNFYQMIASQYEHS